MKDMKVYISGPISGVNNFENIFSNAEEFLKSKGYAVINPVRFNDVLPKDFEYEDFMRLGFAMIDIVDAVYMLPGWDMSKGAQAEFHYAKVLGKIILYPWEEF